MRHVIAAANLPGFESIRARGLENQERIRQQRRERSNYPQTLIFADIRKAILAANDVRGKPEHEASVIAAYELWNRHQDNLSNSEHAITFLALRAEIAYLNRGQA